jgi:hypothetical protein
MNGRMNRRAALRQAGRFAGVAALWAGLAGRTWAALPPTPGWSDDEALLTLIGDTILPATDGSPGAGAVEIGRFMVFMVGDCYPPAAADALRRGVREIADAARAQSGKTFSELTPAQREAVLVAQENRAAQTTKGGAINSFRLIKELTLLGYFTSEPGATKAVRYDPVPGGYRGSVKLAPGDRSWAS